MKHTGSNQRNVEGKILKKIDINLTLKESGLKSDKIQRNNEEVVG
jgi:hypothetical protein